MFQKILNYLVTADPKSPGTYYPSATGNIVLFIVIVLLFVLMLVISGSKKKVRAKQLAFSALAVTMAVITSMYAIYEFPFGGSITLFSMLFVCMIGYFYGAKAGIITGVAYGLLDFILKPYAVSFVQPILDYPLAFGCLGLSGVFSKSKNGIIKGYILGVAGRYLCHVISGIIFFAEDAGGKNVLFYSLAYNASYILPEAAVTILLLLIPPVRQALGQVKRMAQEN